MARQFVLVGPGRAGLSVASALSEIGWELVRTYGRGDDVASAAAGVDLCIVATPDSAIAQTAKAISSAEAVLMHLSGATTLDALGAHRRCSLHPLTSLADPVTGAQTLRSTWFAVAGDEIATTLAEELSGRHFEVSDADRALYHAAAAVGANHLVALLGQVERLAAEISVPFEAFLPLARASLENTGALGPARALTGPAARGDEETIRQHRAALAERLPDELPAYDALLALARRLVPSADIPAD